MYAKKKYMSIFGRLQNRITIIGHLDKYYNLFKSQDTLVTDDVYSDLNIEELFHYSNRCISPVGEMLLYYRLRHLSKNSNLDLSERVINRISDSTDFRKRLELILTKFTKNINYSISDVLDVPTNLSKWHQYLKYIPIVYGLMLLPFLLFGQTVNLILAIVLMLVLNSIIHYWNKIYIDLHIRPLIYLLKLKATASDLCEVDEFYATKDIKESIDVIGKLEKSYFVFGLNKYVESDFALLFTFIIEFVKTVLLIEPIMTNVIANKNVEYKLHSKRLIDYIGEWDVSFSIASFRTWLNYNKCVYSTPVYSNSEACCFKATDLYNPLIIDCVPNDVDIDYTIMITGSNMSGKSTFLRTLGLNIISSYALNTCYASSMRLSEFKLYTILSVADNLIASKSYYSSEVERMKFAIDKCSSEPLNCSNIVLIDEIFKGTNTAERISIANAVINYFIELHNTIVVVSTHDIELAYSFDGIVDIYHFDESIDHNKLIFDYKLKPGLEYKRNAISLLEYYDYPLDIIQKAKLNVHKIKDSFNLKL